MIELQFFFTYANENLKVSNSKLAAFEEHPGYQCLFLQACERAECSFCCRFHYTKLEGEQEDYARQFRDVTLALTTAARALEQSHAELKAVRAQLALYVKAFENYEAACA